MSLLPLGKIGKKVKRITGSRKTCANLPAFCLAKPVGYGSVASNHLVYVDGIVPVTKFVKGLEGG